MILKATFVVWDKNIAYNFRITGQILIYFYTVKYLSWFYKSNKNVLVFDLDL